jgi:hypothetical protein
MLIVVMKTNGFSLTVQVPTSSEYRHGTIPSDLRLWLGDKALRQLARQETAWRVETSGVSWYDCPLAPSRTSPASILTLLSYCYAIGIYGSQEIMRQLASHRALAELVYDDSLDVPQLRLVRRRGRQLLHEILICLLREAWSSRYLGWPLVTESQTAVSRWMPGNRYSPPVAEFVYEAEARIREAILQDQMENDAD